MYMLFVGFLYRFSGPFCDIIMCMYMKGEVQEKANINNNS